MTVHKYTIPRLPCWYNQHNPTRQLSQKLCPGLVILTGRRNTSRQIGHLKFAAELAVSSLIRI